MKNKGNYIDGQWDEASGNPFFSQNPATGEKLWEGKASSSTDITNAVDAAKKAFDSWSRVPLNDRIRYLKAFEAALKDNIPSLSEIISQENGKPLWESKNEVQSMIAKVDISIEAFHQRCSIATKEQHGATSVTRHKPHGAVAVFGPFNFPAHLPNGHIIPALLAGNTVIFKPSEYTPMTAQATTEIWEKVKLPPGVLNMVQGGRETGEHLSRHPKIDGLYFTGSASTGKMLSEILASHIEKILALELGGNNPLVISQYNDLTATALLIIQSAFQTSGQRCTCARRLILVEDSKTEQLLQTLVSLTKQLLVGPYNATPEPYMGPVISEKTALNLIEYEKTLHDQGGMPLLQMNHLKKGTGLLSPGIVDMTSVEKKSDIEIFGPLLQVITVANLESAIEEANTTAYGLTAGIVTDDDSEYEQFYSRVKAGLINRNTPLTGASSAAPFGGVGCSGNHRPSGYYAVDYCSYPVASMENKLLGMPKTLPQGISL